MQVLLLLSLTAQQPASPPPPPPSPAKRTVEFTGTVLLNGFYNSARTSNSDVPVFADTDATGVTGGSATMRQTRLGVLVTEPDVLGGSFSGEIEVDFFGGQQPAAGNRTFPLVRLRRAIGTVQWTHVQLMFGQETALVSDRNPRSLAGVGVPDFSLAGNLWFWLPQARVTAEYGDTLLSSRAVTFDTRVKLGPAEIIGEAFIGQAIAGLGGGAIGQNVGVGGAPVRTSGGWGQLNLRPRAGWMFGAGCGIDDPKDADVLANGRFRNFVCEGHVEWRPPGPLVFGFEFRRLSTRYQAGDFTVNHLNLAAGFRF